MSAIAADTFRSDLYERLAAYHIRIPALAERPEDIEPLIDHFIRAFGTPGMSMDPTCLAFFKEQKWPRNVRQLQNTVKAMIHHANGQELEISDLPLGYFDEDLDSDECKDGDPDTFVFRGKFGEEIEMILEQCEAAYIRASAALLGPNASTRALADQLRMPNSNLQRRLSKYGLSIQRRVVDTDIKKPR